jgi:hypothetical protein
MNILCEVHKVPIARASSIFSKHILTGTVNTI